MIARPLLKRKTIWWPTLSGWALLTVLVLAPALFWWFQGESYLSQTSRIPAEILVIEGWIGSDALRAAENEIQLGSYQYIVTTSGLTGDRWDKDRESYAIIAANRLRASGISSARILLAIPKDTEARRTYQSALAVRQTLLDNSIKPAGIDVFTFGPHARRSRLVFAKVFGSNTKVGVISWTPPGYVDSPWWHSSDRSNELIRESVGYLFEALLNSGRFFHPAPPASHA